MTCTSLFILFCALALINSIVSAQGDGVPLLVDTPLTFDACSFEGPTFRTGISEDTYVYYAPMSQVAACLSSFTLSKPNVTQYLQSMLDITKNFYVFVDQAVDPLQTISSKTPFDYPIYNESYAGKVDVLSEIQSLFQQVEETSENDISIDILYQVRAVYNRLWDAHVTVDTILNLSPLLQSFLYLVSDDVMTPLNDQDNNNASSPVYPTNIIVRIVYPTDDDSFVLQQSLLYPDPVLGEFNLQSVDKVIETIDGVAPLEFFTEFAKLPLGLIGLKSLGPRVTGILRGIQSSNFPSFGVLLGNAKYADYVKDFYEVTFTDGSSTKWTLYQDIHNVISTNISRAEIQDALLQPGVLYTNYSAARSDVVGFIPDRKSNSLSFNAPTTKTSSHQQQPQRELQGGGLTIPERINFTKYFDVSGINEIIGVAVLDDYAVFKLQTFEIEYETILPAWKELVQQAATKNVTRLIIDLSLNGGGEVVTGYFLALLMYPEVTNFEDFANPTDQLYVDPMEIVWEGIVPLVSNITTGFEDNTLQPSLDFLNADAEVLVEKIQNVATALQVIQNFVPSDINLAAAEAALLIANSVEANREINEAELNLLVTSLLASFDAITKEGGLTGLVQDNTYSPFGNQAPGIVSHIRGGITGTYTNPFFLASPDLIVTFKAAIEMNIDNPNQFDEYLILSDGYAVGSTSCQFQLITTLFAKTNEKATPVHTVGYSGNGKQEDAATTQFCGGAVLDSDLNQLWVPDVLLLVLSILYEGNPSMESKIGNLLIDFTESIPEPCYYCDRAPRMTALESYSVLVGTNSTPMEYVNQGVDYYIPQWAFFNDLGFGVDLPYLYNRTAALFGQNNGNGGNNNDGSSTGGGNDNSVGGDNDNGTGGDTGSGTGGENGNATDGGIDGGPSSSTTLGCIMALGATLLAAAAASYLCDM